MKPIGLGLFLVACSFAQTSPFPASLDSNATLGVPADNVSSALTSPMLIGDTTAQVANATRIPQWSLVNYGAELVQVCLVSGNTLTFGTAAACPSIAGRGLSSTTIAAHNTGVIGYLNVNGYYHKATSSAVVAIESSIPRTISDVPFLTGGLTFYQACTSAANLGLELSLSGSWLGVDTGSCAAKVRRYTGGKVRPASGKTVTFPLVPGAALETICDISAGGTCNITGVSTMLPEWFGATFASADAGTAAAINSLRNVQFQAGTYIFAAPITALQGKANTGIFCAGTGQTILSWPSYTTTNGVLIDLRGAGESNLTIQGCTISGAGIAAGTNVRGIYSTGHVGNNGLLMQDVFVTNISGNGIDIEDWFSGTTYIGVWVANSGGICQLSDGDQFPIFIGSRHFTNNCGSYAWDVREGAATMIGLNAGAPLGGGAHFGTAGGSEFAKPSITGMNIEGVSTAGGVGLYFEIGSGLVNAAGITLQCQTVVCGNAVFAANYGQSGTWGQITTEVFNGGTWTTPLFTATTNVPGTAILNIGNANGAFNSVFQGILTGPRNGSWFGNNGGADATFAELPTCPGPLANKPELIVDSTTATPGAVAAGAGGLRAVVTCSSYTNHWLVLQSWVN